MDLLTRNARQQARQQADREREQKALGGATAMSEALHRARAVQGNVSTKPNEARHGPHTTAEAYRAGHFFP